MRDFPSKSILEFELSDFRNTCVHAKFFHMRGSGLKSFRFRNLDHMHIVYVSQKKRCLRNSNGYRKSSAYPISYFNLPPSVVYSIPK